MQISRMIDMLLRSITKRKKAVLIEIKTYKNGKVYKSYRLTIENKTFDFKNQIETLLFIQDRKWK